jgi:DNA-binding response OmpR family regulator
VRAAEFGADEYLVKPFELVALVSQIKELHDFLR